MKFVLFIALAILVSTVQAFSPLDTFPPQGVSFDQFWIGGFSWCENPVCSIYAPHYVCFAGNGMVWELHQNIVGVWKPDMQAQFPGLPNFGRRSA